jgi:hypothetical protein
MAKQGMALGMPTDLSTFPKVCEHCVIGKQSKTAVPKTREGERAKGIQEKVYSDITGPEDIYTGGKCYVINFVDNHSRKQWVYFLAKKSNAVKTFKAWEAKVGLSTGCHVKVYFTDNGGEYTSGEFEKYLNKQGVEHQVMAPYTSAQNGTAERSHRTMMLRGQAIWSESNFPPSLRAECVQAAVYLKNHTPTWVLKNITPYEVWHGRKPNLSHLHELGCWAFVLIQNKSNPKIYGQSTECILVGYSDNLKSYCCYNRKTGQIIVSDDVHFIEAKDNMEHPLHPGLIVNDNDDEEEEETPQSTANNPDPVLFGVIPRDEEDIEWVDDAEEGVLMENPPPEDQELKPNPDTLRHSRCIAPSSVGGAAMKNIPRRTRLEDAIESTKQSAERLESEKVACCEAIQAKLNTDEAHLNMEEDFLLQCEAEISDNSDTVKHSTCIRASRTYINRH